MRAFTTSKARWIELRTKGNIKVIINTANITSVGDSYNGDHRVSRIVLTNGNNIRTTTRYSEIIEALTGKR